MAQIDFGDTVVVRSGQGIALAWVCGLRVLGSDAKRDNDVSPAGTVLVLVEFEDGASAEIADTDIVGKVVPYHDVG